MSLATRLEQALKGRAATEDEAAIITALKFQEAVERHDMTLIKTATGWLADSYILRDYYAARGATPAAAVASLVAELEKK